MIVLPFKNLPTSFIIVDLLSLLYVCLYQGDFSFHNFHVSGVVFSSPLSEIPLTFLVKWFGGAEPF